MPTCESDNAQSVDQSSFWDEDGINWDAHRIGWAIAGGCAVLTLIITAIGVFRHARNYTVPGEQRQVIRILYMPSVYAIISFFSYRFFRDYTYYSLIEVGLHSYPILESSTLTGFKAITLSAFMLLLIEYVAATAAGHDADNAIARKDKRKLPLPFCCWRYRPTKAYFMYTVKWSVLQYVIIRPLVSIVGVVCEKFKVLCESEGFDYHYANVYLEVVDFISITIALYGLLIFYGLTAEELKGRRPLSKFVCIKLIVMVPFYQGFVFSWLESSGRIKATKYWSASNIVNGLNALAICIEMTKIWRALWDSINYGDFFYEIYLSFQFFADYLRGKPTAHGHGHRADFGAAFGVEGRKSAGYIGTNRNTPYNYVSSPP
ncbi:DUF300-domain-containing protein [Mucidula mucida]|nr:DUF300-domain-containing protein [Mucidula mucida]